MPPSQLDRQIAAMRHFSRRYTQKIGVLRARLLQSSFSLTEARLLFELAQRKDAVAGELARELDLDPGYLSRILQGFQRKGLLQRRPAREDARRGLLNLTARGRAAFAVLDRRSRAEVAAMLGPLPEADRVRLLGAMRQIEQILLPDTAAPPFEIRTHRPGDIGWVISRHGSLYAREYGWDISFEAMVAEIGARFIREFNPAREVCYIAERAGEPVGSVFIVAKSARVAQLRMLIVDPAARGLGVGARLVAEAESFARAKGYTKIMLWTNSVLLEARRLYQRAGYKLTGRERHSSFGKRLVGEIWEKAL